MKESLYGKLTLAVIASLVFGISVPYLVSVWLGISNIEIPTIYLDWVDKVGFITAFLASLASTLLLKFWLNKSNPK